MAKTWKEHAEEALRAFRVDPVALGTPEQRREAAESLTRTVAGVAGAIALQPLPIADIALMLPIQTALVLKIAQIYQVPLDYRRTQAIVGVALTGMLARRLAGAAAKLLPGVGTLASVPIAYGATMAMGKGAMLHFARGGGADYQSLKAAITHHPMEPAATPLPETTEPPSTTESPKEP